MEAATAERKSVHSDTIAGAFAEAGVDSERVKAAYNMFEAQVFLKSLDKLEAAIDSGDINKAGVTDAECNEIAESVSTALGVKYRWNDGVEFYEEH